MNKDPNLPLNQLKISAFDRRLSVAKASLIIGKRWAANSAFGLFKSKQQKDQQKKQFMKEQAQYLVDELGKLKGSVVKIGQMMALYGEHFLPEEITEALQTLNDNTATFAYDIIKTALQQQLGDKILEFDIDAIPIGTASLAQVHKAIHKTTGQTVVFKVQYPNIADAVDSDLDLFKQLLRLTNIVPQTRQLDEWFEEIGNLLHNEVDYFLEAATTQTFYQRLQADNRYIVPKIWAEYSSQRVLCMSYEEGVSIVDEQIFNLSQDRRDAIGQASIEIMLKEIFEWGDMQTDPNFGNYLIRLQEASGLANDQLILLDFGAIRQFDEYLLATARDFLLAGHQHDRYKMLQAIEKAGEFYPFFANANASIKNDMADLFLLASEPFSLPDKNPNIPKNCLDKYGNYLWADSDLHNRVLKFASQCAISKSFSIPPKEFMFISRKFIGAYTFMTVLQAKTDAKVLMKRILDSQLAI